MDAGLLRQLSDLVRYAVMHDIRDGSIATCAPDYRRILNDIHLHDTIPFPRDAEAVMKRLVDGHSLDLARDLAWMTARVGSSVMASNHKQLDPRLLTDPGPAVSELFSHIQFSTSAPPEGFLADSVDPASGFAPFQFDGIQTAFFRRPEDMGEPWASFIGPHWQGGMGLIVFQHPESGATGMIFVHTLARVPWSKPKPNRWQTSGGTMAFPLRKFPFPVVLEKTVDKGVAMTWKWRAGQRLFDRAGIRKIIGLGGSKGLILYPEGTDGQTKGLDIYAKVLRRFGITLTGCDEGLTPTMADYLAERAQFNIYGSQKSAYKGRNPTFYTAAGIDAVMARMQDDRYGDDHRPILMVGCGGIGRALREHLSLREREVAGIVDVERNTLIGAQQGELGALSLFVGEAEVSRTPAAIGDPFHHLREGKRRAPSTYLADLGRFMAYGMYSDRDLAAVIRRPQYKEAVLSANGTIHPLTFAVAEAMIDAGIHLEVGAANNVLGLDPDGSPDLIDWILRAAGTDVAPDFVVNQMGALAVSSGAMGHTNHDMRLLVDALPDEVAELCSRETGLEPPSVKTVKRAQADWRAMKDPGSAVGGDL